MRLLCWNVHGLPFRTIPEDAIKERVDSYDLVCLQETWQRDDARALAKGRVFHWWQRLRWWIPIWRSPSGLLLISSLPATERRSVRFRATSAGKFDFVTVKGAQLARFASGGPTPWVVNTHLDSGGDEGDFDARARQLAQLAEALPDGPLVLCGDLNLDEDRAPDVAMLGGFLARTGLRIAVRNDLDFILTRGLTGDPKGAVLPDEGLSDHRAIVLEG